MALWQWLCLGNQERGEQSVCEIMQICENNLQKLFFTEEKKNEYRTKKSQTSYSSNKNDNDNDKNDYYD